MSTRASSEFTHTGPVAEPVINDTGALSLDWPTELPDVCLMARELLVEMIDQLNERRQMLRWQAEATEVLKAWDQVADLVPGAFLVLGARRSACVHAYIDHLRAEVESLRSELHSARGEVTD